MKFDELRSIAHNISDSLASGVGLPIGVYGTDIFGEARRSTDGFITVDFLTGTSVGGRPSPLLAEAIAQYRNALTCLCVKHRTSVAAFRKLTTRYSKHLDVPRFVVTVEDIRGRRSVDEYAGFPAARIRVLDHLGRIRRK
jgi:hypothetical protein